MYSQTLQGRIELITIHGRNVIQAGRICKQYTYGISRYKFAKMIESCFSQAFSLSIQPFIRLHK